MDVSDAWSEEDLHDLMQASLAYAERASLLADRIGRDVKLKRVCSSVVSC